MVKKKNTESKIQPEDIHASQENIPTPPDSALPVAEPEGAEKAADGDAATDEILKLKMDLEELTDRYHRLYAEFDNFRKRTLRERADLLKTAASGLITQLLPVLDDFERALAAFRTTSETDALKEGVDLIFRNFKRTLEQKGLEEIKSIGEPFTTDLHEAVTNMPAPSEEMKGKVTEEIVKGYMLNGTVIRFAQVVVAN